MDMAPCIPKAVWGFNGTERPGAVYLAAVLAGHNQKGLPAFQETITQAVEYARKGTTVLIVGVFSEKPQVDLGLVQDRELSLVGTLMYQKRDYERSIELVASGNLCLDEMITHHFPLKDYMNAYKTIDEAAGNIMKVMIKLD
jgi:L-iditol 2-dehydrogenase